MRHENCHTARARQPRVKTGLWTGKGARTSAVLIRACPPASRALRSLDDAALFALFFSGTEAGSTASLLESASVLVMERRVHQLALRRDRLFVTSETVSQSLSNRARQVLSQRRAERMLVMVSLPCSRD